MSISATHRCCHFWRCLQQQLCSLSLPMWPALQKDCHKQCKNNQTDWRYACCQTWHRTLKFPIAIIAINDHLVPSAHYLPQDDAFHDIRHAAFHNHKYSSKNGNLSRDFNGMKTLKTELPLSVDCSYRLLVRTKSAHLGRQQPRFQGFFLPSAKFPFHLIFLVNVPKFRLNGSLFGLIEQILDVLILRLISLDFGWFFG